jgi:hypothetical protein
MFKWLKEKLSGLFMNEVRVQRPGSQPIDVPLNRKQRRTKGALVRKHAQRRKRAAISRSKGN